MACRSIPGARQNGGRALEFPAGYCAQQRAGRGRPDEFPGRTIRRVAVIRREATEIFGEEFAGQLRILYGGSVKPENVSSLMSEEEIDGALFGGASLDPKSFTAIVKY